MRPIVGTRCEAGALVALPILFPYDDDGGCGCG